MCTSPYLPSTDALFKGIGRRESRGLCQKITAWITTSSFSEQKPSTEYRCRRYGEQALSRVTAKLLFRPGGHGALIENLNDLDADVIFIKNIDNVVPDKLKGDTVLYKKLIAGVLITLQQQAFCLSATAGQRQVHARAGSRHPAVCTEEAILQEPRKRRTWKMPNW